MKILVTGTGGQLGYDVVNQLARRNHDVIGSYHREDYSQIADKTTVHYVRMDITDSNAVKKVINNLNFYTNIPT